jgi:hypothetical protein
MGRGQEVVIQKIKRFLANWREAKARADEHERTRRRTPEDCARSLRWALNRGYTERRGYTVCQRETDGSVYIAVWLDKPEGML